jgi:hypothetical protein
MVARNNVQHRAASVQHQRQDETSSPTSRKVTHLSFAATHTAMHSNRATRIGVNISIDALLAAAAPHAST